MFRSSCSRCSCFSSLAERLAHGIWSTVYRWRLRVDLSIGLTSCPFDFLSAGLCLSNCPSVPGPHVQLRVCKPQGAAPQEALPSGGLSLTLLFSLPASIAGCMCVRLPCWHMLLKSPLLLPLSLCWEMSSGSLCSLRSLEEFAYLHGDVFVFSRAGQYDDREYGYCCYCEKLSHWPFFFLLQTHWTHLIWCWTFYRFLSSPFSMKRFTFVFFYV